ncbi:MAG: rRNA pseudouridine synthase [Clostridia bacterium]|nr:rRNA pseudouridine synthase [Clostridia bacterium]
MEKIRLQKFFTDCGVLSRRAAEAEIAAGKVKVNGEIAETGQKIDPETDTVEYKGKIINTYEKPHYTYVMLNKPRGYLSSVKDDRGRKCVTELVEDAGVRLYPVGRLDMDSEGLLLMTNDGELTNKLTHPKHEIPKIYHVKIKGKVTEEQVKALSKPMNIDGYTILPVETKLISIKQDYSVLEMILYEGRNRQIRKMCEQTELKILRLCRIAIGNVKLGELAPGKWKYLNKTQVSYLKGLKP